MLTTYKDSCIYLAKRILKRGESKFIGENCLIPSEYKEVANKNTPEDFFTCCDIIVKENRATHYSLKWEEEGKVIKLTLYKTDFYGATKVTENMKIDELIISL